MLLAAHPSSAFAALRHLLPQGEKGAPASAFPPIASTGDLHWRQCNAPPSPGEGVEAKPRRMRGAQPSVGARDKSRTPNQGEKGAPASAFPPIASTGDCIGDSAMLHLLPARGEGVEAKPRPDEGGMLQPSAEITGHVRAPLSGGGAHERKRTARKALAKRRRFHRRLPGHRPRSTAEGCVALHPVLRQAGQGTFPAAA